jgi:hypothetical protein
LEILLAKVSELEWEKERVLAWELESGLVLASELVKALVSARDWALWPECSRIE